MAFLNPRDSLHGKASKLDLVNPVLNQLVFAEVANVVQKRVKDKKTVSLLLKQVFEDVPILALSDAVLEQALSEFLLHYPKISFTDATLLVQSKATGMPLLSFDEDLMKIAD